MEKTCYIIITPAKNEEKFIEKTITSVINQTILPFMWVIVDDGSTDSTPEIVKRYTDKYNFIRLVRREKENSRNFGSKVYAIRRGFEELKDFDYDFYCNLDADVSFEANYFETLIKKFNNNPRLGICGGEVYDLIKDRFVAHRSLNHSVAGPVQFFRRNCYESFGGYHPSPIGFIDGHAEISARMNGWITETFPELRVNHHRMTGLHKGSVFRKHLEEGKKQYLFGYSYFYVIIRNLKVIKSKPFILSYYLIVLGYHIPIMRRESRLVDRDFVKFVRNEQKQRLLSRIKQIFNL